MELASFDIFDTILIRKSGKPDNIFYLLANRLYPTNITKRESFFIWRKKAESENLINDRETNLNDIYSNKTLDIYNEYTPQQIQNIEKQIEAENLIVNPTVKAIIDNKRKEGFTICFISDMYLDSTFLSNILRREDCLINDEKVYVSCEMNARKSNGKLYKNLKKKLSPKIWIHYGDNPISDVKIPRKLGIKAYHVNTKFNDIEQYKISLSSKIKYDYELSILTGLERAARITLGNNAFTTFAANYVSPAYISYMYFVMENARERHIKRLYFLSRDSFILMKIAESMHEQYPEIELKYLFVSRKSLLLPYLNEINIDDYLNVQDHRTIIGHHVNSLLDALNTSVKEMRDKYNISFTYKKITSIKEQKDFLIKIFDTNSTYLPTLRKRIKQRRQSILEYFKQENILNDDKIGMVDIGWLGTSRLMINTILKSEGFRPVDFFYYGIRRDVFPIKYGNYMSYYKPNQLNTSLTSLLENYFSASPYPTTIGYKNTDGNIVPIFPNNKNKKETKITKSNIRVSQWLVKEIITININLKSVFWEWANISNKNLSTLKTKIDLSPLLYASKFDGQSFVRKLSIFEIFDILFLGNNITAYDKASTQITCGRFFTKTLWPLHEFTGKLRTFLYLKTRK